MYTHVAGTERGKTRPLEPKLFIIETLPSHDALNQCAQKAPALSPRVLLPAKLTDSKTGVASTSKPPGAFCEPHSSRGRRQYYILGHRVSTPGFREDRVLRFQTVVSKVRSFLAVGISFFFLLIPLSCRFILISIGDGNIPTPRRCRRPASKRCDS